MDQFEPVFGAISDSVGTEAASGVGQRQPFPDFPGENPTKAVLEAWTRAHEAARSPLHEAAARDQPPAKLVAETTEFDLTALPALGASASDDLKMKRDEAVQMHLHRN